MNGISNTIYQTYTSRFTELEPKTQLHFSSRLAQWNDDPTARQLLAQTVANTRPAEASIHDILMALLTASADSNPNINEQAHRQKYFEQYPQLYGLHQALFQVRNWLYHYNLDARQILHELPAFPDYHTLLAALFQDSEALGVLSTYAVNTAYLTRRLLDNDESVIFSLDRVHELEPVLPNPLLRTYFVTHCIIGETLFYARPLPAEKLEDYRQMLIDLENALNSDLAGLTLDAQLELLVAHKLCGTTSNFESEILAAAAKHFDTNPGFITDPKRPHKNTLELAEHRNVMYLLATTPCKLTA